MRMRAFLAIAAISAGLAVCGSPMPSGMINVGTVTVTQTGTPGASGPSLPAPAPRGEPPSDPGPACPPVTAGKPCVPNCPCGS